jgi:hypothetical protein
VPGVRYASLGRRCDGRPGAQEVEGRARGMLAGLAGRDVDLFLARLLMGGRSSWNLLNTRRSPSAPTWC